MVKRFSICAVAPLLALLGACGEAGEVYPLPGREVRQTLRGIELPVVLGFSTSTRAIDNGDGSLTWHAKRDGKTAMRYVVRTEEVDAGSTRITLDLIPPTDAAEDPVKKQFDEHPGVRTAYLQAMVEQIDSQLENRPYDMAEASTAAMHVVQVEMEEFSEMAQEAQRSKRSTWSSDSPEVEFGEPMQ
jgi:hypothetical protein